ncbi:hypothetical protein BDR05DRAFT_964989, partial [Suillus weaverae]
MAMEPSKRARMNVLTSVVGLGRTCYSTVSRCRFHWHDRECACQEGAPEGVRIIIGARNGSVATLEVRLCIA